MTEGPAQGGLKGAVGRRGSLSRTLQAVAWSFFGVRKASEHEKDVEQLNPVHVVIAGLVAAVFFVVVLLALATWVSSGAAH